MAWVLPLSRPLSEAAAPLLKVIFKMRKNRTEYAMPERNLLM